jgi:hypothetical protein
MRCVDSSEITRLFAGQLSEERVELLQVHFKHCVKCAALKDDVLAMTARLQHDPGELDDPTAVDEVMALVRMGKAEQEATGENTRAWWRAWQTWLLVPATAAATAMVMTVFWPHREGTTDDGFQARGRETVNLDRWVSLQVFRSTGHGYEPVHDVVAADEALAFAYLNQSGDQLHYLAVFGVDERGELLWYYPPNTSADRDPTSISIRGGAQPIELPEQVTHDLRPGLLRIFGIFSSGPLSVRAIEEQLQQDLRAAQTVERMARVGLDDVGQYSLPLRVQGAAEEDSTR